MTEETEEKTTIEVDSREYAEMLTLSEIMRQLTESERFQRFFKINYEVQTKVDPESKTYDIILIERPPEVAAQELYKMVEEKTPNVEIPSAQEIAAITKKSN